MNGVLGMIEVPERQGLAKDQRRIILTMRESAQALLRIIHAGTDHRLEHLAQDVAIAKPAVAINRERRMIGNLVIELEAAEPTIIEMKFDLLS
jgi:hypothetical protein